MSGYNNCGKRGIGLLWNMSAQDEFNETTDTPTGMNYLRNEFRILDL
jgi:hypothetical protein